MSLPDGFNGLRFACDCVSARENNYSDPWAAIAQKKLLPDGTKEEILNLVAQEPKTISQLAEALRLSPPTVHMHIADMLKSELLCESEEWEKKHPTERYYEPNFPIVKSDERAEFEALCFEIAERIADLFERRRPQLKRAFHRTTLVEQGWDFSDITQYLYACVQRTARARLEERGVLSPPPEHANGIKWNFWAEQPEADSSSK